MVFIDSVNQYATSFADYLNKNNGKVVAIVSPNQYAVEIDKYVSHEDMILDLVRRTRPNMKMDNWGNAIDPNDDYRNDTVLILGHPGYIQIELPLREKLNYNQYNCLCNILTAIQDMNISIDKTGIGKKYELLVFGFGMLEVAPRNYQDEIPSLINQLKAFATDIPYHIDETIIGQPYMNQESNNNLVDNMITQMENNTIDADGNPILESDSDLKLKGYSNIILLILVTSIVSVLILVLGILIEH